MFPGGPKFIHLMYHFARYVAIKYIKTKSSSKFTYTLFVFILKLFIILKSRSK